jgi:hypothetical protein
LNDARETTVGKHERDPKKDKSFTPEKPQPDTRKGGDGKHAAKDGAKK